MINRSRRQNRIEETERKQNPRGKGQGKCGSLGSSVVRESSPAGPRISLGGKENSGGWPEGRKGDAGSAHREEGRPGGREGGRGVQTEGREERREGKSKEGKNVKWLGKRKGKRKGKKGE